MYAVAYYVGISLFHEQTLCETFTSGDLQIDLDIESFIIIIRFVGLPFNLPDWYTLERQTSHSHLCCGGWTYEGLWGIKRHFMFFPLFSCPLSSLHSPLFLQFLANELEKAGARAFTAVLLDDSSNIINVIEESFKVSPTVIWMWYTEGKPLVNPLLASIYFPFFHTLLWLH